MTMNDRITNLIRRIARTRDENHDAVPVDDHIIHTLALSINALSTALELDPHAIPSMLDLAYDNVMREPASTNNDLMYAYMLCMFTLYRFTDDDYDALQALFTNDQGESHITV